MNWVPSMPKLSCIGKIIVLVCRCMQFVGGFNISCYYEEYFVSGFLKFMDVMLTNLGAQLGLP